MPLKRWIGTALGLSLVPCACPAGAQTFGDLRQLSLDQLTQVDVSSVTKTPQPIAQAPAAVYVIDHDAIQRSGATTLPEALRLAPNLVVARQSSSQYVVSARGQSGNPDNQNFANKLLVLIDGRSVYTPLFSGVYWDMQDVVLADVDRIEVISGPGATLWGANAVNGVINIITRGAGETQGLLAQGSAGTLDRTATLRYGGRAGADVAYRLYAQGIQGDATRVAVGGSAQDDRWRAQAGFRVDWTPGGRDRFTLQGDAYEGARGQFGTSDERIVGRNILARWNRATAPDANLQVQAYYDRTVRHTLDGGGRFALDTYDVDAQQSFTLGSAHAFVVGAGARTSHYRIEGAGGLAFLPEARTTLLLNAFVQDTAALTRRLSLTLGLKLEKDPFADATWLPSARLAWNPDPNVLLWGAVSGAVRSATPFDRDVQETFGPILYLTGDRDFRSEKLTAVELGSRLSPTGRLSISITGFHHIYDDLRTVEPAADGSIPFRWANGLAGTTWGADAWADWRALDWWTLSASLSLLDGHFRFDPGASGLLGTAQLGSDPKHQATLRSAMDLGSGVTLDASLRHVGPFPEPRLPAYLELDARLGVRLRDRLTLSLAGANLLHARHQEYPGTTGNLIPRQIWAAATWQW